MKAPEELWVMNFEDPEEVEGTDDVCAEAFYNPCDPSDEAVMYIRADIAAEKEKELREVREALNRIKSIAYIHETEQDEQIFDIAHTALTTEGEKGEESGEICAWKPGAPSGFPSFVFYENDEDDDGAAGYGIAYAIHEMAGAPFVALTDGGDIPAKWIVRHEQLVPINSFNKRKEG